MLYGNLRRAMKRTLIGKRYKLFKRRALCGHLQSGAFNLYCKANTNKWVKPRMLSKFCSINEVYFLSKKDVVMKGESEKRPFHDNDCWIFDAMAVEIAPHR